MKLTIKQVEVRDIGPSLQLVRRFFAEEGPENRYPVIDDEELDQLGMAMLSSLNSPSSLYLIAYDGKKPTGVFIGEVIQRTYGKPRVFGVARDLYVVPEKRGQGVGTKLMATALYYARALGLTYIEAIARPGKLQTKWEKYGFKPYLINSSMSIEAAPVFKHEKS